MTTMVLATVPQTIKSLTAVTVSGLSCSVANGTTYQVRGQVYYTPNRAAGAAILQFGGTSSKGANSRSVFLEYAMPAGGTSGAFVQGNAAVLTPGQNTWQGTAMGTVDRYVIFEGVFVCSGAGTFTLQALCTVAADTWAIKAGTYMEVSPVT